MSRLVCVGCSHGIHIDPIKRKKVLQFVKDFNPDVVVHLGDFLDTTAFMGSARDGTTESTVSIDEDVESGLKFLADIRCNVLTLGNHEERLLRASKCPSAIRAKCAADVLGQIHSRCRENGCKVYPYDFRASPTFGGYKFWHGNLWNENYLRDSAETYGNIVVAHGHRPGISLGRRQDQPIALGVGRLCKEMDYARLRRSTMAWGAGIVYGNFSSNGADFRLKLI